MRGLRAGLAGLGAIMLTACGGGAEPPAPVGPDPAGLSEQVLAERLGEAIRFETISEEGNPDASAEQFAAFRDWLEETFPLVHEQMAPEIVAGGSLWFTLEGTEPDLNPVVILAHQDVVPVEAGTEDQWTRPPFSGAVADGFVWGRGALDMKGFLVMAMTGMETLLEEGFTPARTIHIGLGHDEEVGGLGAQAMAARLADAGTRAWFVLDEGGTSIREFPATGGPVAAVGVGEKGYLTVEVTARARGGHSSTPPRETAVGLLSRAINAIVDTPFEHAIEHPMDGMLRAVSADMDGFAAVAAGNPGLFGPVLRGQLMADDTTRAAMGTTIAPTIIEGGVVDNVLPQEARAVINLRLHPRDSSASALAHLRGAVAGLEGVTVEPIGHISEPPAISPATGRAWEIIAGAAAAHAPEGAPVVPNLLSAATDSRHFAGVADMIYRYAPLEMDMGDMARIHGDDERIRVEALPGMVSYFRTVIGEAGRETEAGRAQ
ncbi:M20/M25/M40 family metallo-hydrolase [Glycocaulis profundi]|nr:M20/M25/M40 family metallo-hydrolase [Glycocaulis profundi]